MPEVYIYVRVKYEVDFNNSMAGNIDRKRDKALKVGRNID